MDERKIKVSKDDIEVVDGKVVIKNKEILSAVQSEQGIDLNCADGQDAVSVGLVITF